MPELVRWHLNVGSFVAVIALASYLFKQSLPAEFYQFCYYLYGSTTILVSLSWWLEGNDALFSGLFPVILLVAGFWILSKSIPSWTSSSRRIYHRF